MPSEVTVCGYKCDKCNDIFVSEAGAIDCETRHKAKEYRYKCVDCGKEITPFLSRCHACNLKNVYDKAKSKISFMDYDGVLYDIDGETYYSSYDQMVEEHEDEGLQLPDWVLACIPIPFYLNIDYLIDNTIDDDMDEDFDKQFIVDIKELYEFMEKWNEKQTYNSYTPDYSKVILLKERE